MLRDAKATSIAERMHMKNREFGHDDDDDDDGPKNRKLGCYYIRNHPRFYARPSFEVFRQENPLVLCRTNKTLEVLII